jgi:superfamily II DNA/RNA helicase
VGTPGRILHIVKEANLNLRSIEYLVLDEADRLFEMGLSDQVREILKLTPFKYLK